MEPFMIPGPFLKPLFGAGHLSPRTLLRAGPAAEVAGGVVLNTKWILLQPATNHQQGLDQISSLNAKRAGTSWNELECRTPGSS